MNLKTNFLRNGALALATMFLFTTVVVQPVQAQSLLNSVKCTTLKVFAAASNITIDLSVAAMNAAFQLELNLLQAAWQIEDQAVALIRSVSEQGFTALLSVYSLITARTPSEKAAVTLYKDTILNALNVVHTKIDAARAAYREDMLALVKAHQKALRNLATIATTTIKTALTTALTNCSKPGVVATLISVIASVNVKLVIDGIAEQVTSLAKAVVLVVTRNSLFLQSDLEFVGVGVTATAKLLKDTLGWRKS